MSQGFPLGCRRSSLNTCLTVNSVDLSRTPSLGDLNACSRVVNTSLLWLLCCFHSLGLSSFRTARLCSCADLVPCTFVCNICFVSPIDTPRMTTAARPTFEPARGGRGKGEGDLSALSKQYSSRDLPGHTKIKYRYSWQNSWSTVVLLC